VPLVKISDYIVEYLASVGITDAFMVTGGGAMHLNDSFGKNKNINCIPFHHEQSCAFAADSYFRLTNRLPVVNVTTGPGSTNAITGVYGAWVDSIGMIVISGQVKWETVVRSTGLPLRQLGDQEVDITRIVESITKYAVMVNDPQSIRYHLERALYLATSGRPGPVWLDIPMNIQGAFVDPKKLTAYDPTEDTLIYENDVTTACDKILRRIERAKRPVILAGSGVWRSGQHSNFIQLINKLKIPITTAWNSNDLVTDDNPYYAGRPGTIGNRAGNFTVQNADFILVLGCRLNIRMVSYNWDSFARSAFKAIVDIDSIELKKQTVKADLPVHADLRNIIPKLLSENYTPSTQHVEWLGWCQERCRRYPVIQPEYWNSKKVNNYCFTQTLFEELDENDVIVTADGAAAVVTFQAAIIKEGQRLFHNSGCAPMGYDLPAAIGACIASGKKRVICIAGDGSIQMNLQELQTIIGNNLPIKLFILNNDGYLSIKQTQQSYFNGNLIGCDPDSGVTLPSLYKVMRAYGIPYRSCRNHDEMRDKIQNNIQGAGPQACEVFLDLTQGFAPKLASRQLEDGRIVSPALEDMYPFLSREELKKNMLIPLLDT
jgi:acetolactate synthase I/II/III large subunit